MYRIFFKILLFVIIFPYLLCGCARSGPKLLYYGDGKFDAMRGVDDTGCAIQFTVPSGNWGIKAVRFFAIRQGSGPGQSERMDLAICDDMVQPIYQTSVPMGIVGNVSEKWQSIDVKPPLYHPGSIWVILDTHNTQSERVKIGTDSGVKVSHSKLGRIGGPLSDPDELFDWMIRVELTELNPEEIQKFEGGESPLSPGE